MFNYCVAKNEDIKTVTDLLMLLYYEDDYNELYNSNKEYIENPKMRFFLAFDGNEAIGIAHVALREDYVEGTSGGTVGYFEALYVKPDYRGKGVARKLCSLCEDWSREQGCTEFSSDCDLSNDDSLKFHLKLGFEEAGRIICFTKNL